MMLRPKAHGIGVEPAGRGIRRLAGVDPDRRDPQVQKPRQVPLDMGFERPRNAMQRTGDQPFIDPVVLSPRARFSAVRIRGGERAERLRSATPDPARQDRSAVSGQEAAARVSTTAGASEGHGSTAVARRMPLAGVAIGEVGRGGTSTACCKPAPRPCP